MHIDNPTRAVNEIWNPIDRPENRFSDGSGGSLEPGNHCSTKVGVNNGSAKRKLGEKGGNNLCGDRAPNMVVKLVTSASLNRRTVSIREVQENRSTPSRRVRSTASTSLLPSPLAERAIGRNYKKCGYCRHSILGLNRDTRKV